MALNCPLCGAPNPATGHFCRECGSALASTCPACGAAAEVGQKFCGDCGTAIPRPPAGPPAVEARSAVATAAERRVCSVLFCDLVGFTTLSESRDPEDVRELLSRYFTTARTVIGRYGGAVEKFIGDAVMAVWGAPVALEGDTERAVRAALELVDAVAALGEDLRAPSLAARAGVVTGEVAVTVGAVNEGMVAGDAVNTAARVQAAASPGSVLVDEATRRSAQAGVEFADAGQHPLKGKAGLQHLWQAGRVLSNVGGAQRVDGLEAPITGRDTELRVVKDLFHASADRRQPRLLAITGPAGVGKSRLGWEFEKYVDGLAAAVWWHRGRCLSYGDGVTFWALAEIVRQRLGIAEEDEVEIATSKLVAGVDQHVTDADERRYIGVRLGRLLGVTFSGDDGQELSREELFAGWRLWLERLAATQPVAMLIEDLHYADEGLLDFLDHLLDWARDVPVFVITFSRPELRVQRSSWGSGRNRTLLALDPLDAASMARLLDALVPGIPPAAASAIAVQARGIPLFAVETIRALVDRDIVLPIDGAYRLVGDIGTLTVPDSLHNLLAARLDALDPAVRSLAADAAVLGSSFPAEALVVVSGLDLDEVRAGLADLVRREVLEISADPLSPQRGSYRFAHEMLRQVAYDTLSRRDRKARHLAVAAHLRAVFPGDGDEVADAIARHYLDAVAAVPDDDDADSVRAEAIDALIRAAERATRTGAPARAGAAFAQAAELTESAQPSDPVVAARLWERAATSAMGSAQWPVITDRAERAAAGYAAAGQRREAARAQSVAGHALNQWGRFSDARERLLPAIAVLSEAADADTVAAMSVLAAAATFSDSEDADRLTSEALALAQALAVPAGTLAEVMTRRGVWHAFRGRQVEAAAYHRESARLAEQAGNAAAQSKAVLNLASCLAISDPGTAITVARDSAELARRAADRTLLAYALENVVVAQLQTGAWRDAERTVTEAVEVDGLEHNDLMTSCRAWLAALRGDTETADRLLAGLTDMRASEDVQDRARISVIEAHAAVGHRHTAEALRHARGALACIEALSPTNDTIRWAWPLAARAAHELRDSRAGTELLALVDRYQPGHLASMLQAERELARVRSAADSGADAADLDDRFTAAIAGQRERSTPYHLALGLLDYSEYLLAQSRADDAAVLIEEAQRLGEALEALPITDRARSLAARPVPTLSGS